MYVLNLSGPIKRDDEITPKNVYKSNKITVLRFHENACKETNKVRYQINLNMTNVSYFDLGINMF
jgi:hypothetical protein